MDGFLLLLAGVAFFVGMFLIICMAALFRRIVSGRRYLFVYSAQCLVEAAVALLFWVLLHILSHKNMGTFLYPTEPGFSFFWVLLFYPVAMWWCQKHFIFLVDEKKWQEKYKNIDWLLLFLPMQLFLAGIVGSFLYTSIQLLCSLCIPITFIISFLLNKKEIKPYKLPKWVMCVNWLFLSIVFMLWLAIYHKWFVIEIFANGFIYLFCISMFWAYMMGMAVAYLFLDRARMKLRA